MIRGPRPTTDEVCKAIQDTLKSGVDDIADGIADLLNEIENADKAVAELTAKLDKAESGLKAMQHRWSGHDCYPRDGND